LIPNGISSTRIRSVLFNTKDAYVASVAVAAAAAVVVVV